MNESRKEVISLSQLYILMVIFLIGTAAFLERGGEAKQDIWIAELLGIVAGSGILLLYWSLLNQSKGKNIYELFQLATGRIIGNLLVFVYSIYFLYQASRILRDGIELLKITILKETPIEVMAIAFMVVCGYTLCLGLEVLARLTEILAPYILVFLFLIGIFLFASDAIEFKNFSPILAEGLGPINEAFFPRMLVFPYGELIVFTVIFSASSSTKAAKKVSGLSLITAIFFLVYIEGLEIASLGEGMKTRSLYPFLIATREIALLEFFERADILVVFILVTGVFIKVSLYFYAALKGLEKLFNISYQNLCVPITLLLPLLSIIVAQNINEHNIEGLELTPFLLHIPLQLGVPFLVLLILIIKKIKKRKGKQPPTNKGESSL
ncbi:GerAB/ArcD/ProY family transporter [Bacillus solitudinis]|uniref:GerAB/ArcD/ProY family transporter n=1 Tax=Bacillus solitudinis TaxID=2014074 RepID=UPI000C236786|nr:endospore germination permease [Bacillus solitudinis]